MAWLAATCPNPNFQNSTEAIAAAERAAKLAPANDYLILDTLAAAHASAGHFDQAGDLQQRALSCAPPELAAALKHRLDLYRAGQPFRNGGTGRDAHAGASEADIESSLPVGALR
jgi:tetratricopeptide (TPR) repeat protein